MDSAQLIPAFEARRFFLDPWQTVGEWPTVALALVIAVLCSLLGSLLILRRQALAADAISHSVLPGIVLAYLIFKTVHPVVMMAGASAAGLACVMLIQFLQNRSRMHSDAATGVAFTSFFALGMLLLGKYGRQHDLDMECVLYGNLETVMGDVATPFGWLPSSLITMSCLLLGIIVLLWACYRQWLSTSFDAGFSTTIGMKIRVWNGLLMAVTSMTIVAAMEAVGAVLVVGMMALPAATARLFANRLPTQLVAAAGFALLGALVARHFSLWLNISMAPCMAVTCGMVFLLLWVGQLGVRRWRVAR
jgi:manganese/zinc/iron transport system permease protein